MNNENKDRFYQTISNIEFIANIYSKVLLREPDINGLHTWLVELENGTKRSEVFDSFRNSEEAKLNNLDIENVKISINEVNLKKYLIFGEHEIENIDHPILISILLNQKIPEFCLLAYFVILKKLPDKESLEHLYSICIRNNGKFIYLNFLINSLKNTNNNDYLYLKRAINKYFPFNLWRILGKLNYNSNIERSKAILLTQTNIGLEELDIVNIEKLAIELNIIDFYQYDGKEFINKVYDFLFQKKPSIAASNYWLESLLKGESKVSIINKISFFGNKTTKLQEIKNFRILLFYDRLNETPVIGNILSLFLFILNINKITRLIRSYEQIVKIKT